MDRNALDWIFSTAPQALAAFIGLIFAGVALMNSTIDNRIINKPDMKEVYEAFKARTLKKLMRLLWGASIAIILDIIILAFTPLENKIIILVIAIVLGIYNIIVLIWAIRYIKSILDPKTFNKNIDQQLSKTNAAIFMMVGNNKKTNTDEKGSISIGTFLTHYIDFEKVIQASVENTNHIPIHQQYSVKEIIDIVKSLNIISEKDYEILQEIRQYRNLVAHGQKTEIPKEIDDQLVKLTNKIKMK
ncbi:hypothetical protein [Bacteroides bouchesdurhonensis]|uniref:hypothetical protein n=1 Tax=Bacteroides bouchesdurhonensis TaxID=1841855 RepID=UPI0022E3D27C|nr:hypothetical protein [Bacteroides bouchesdurhonensis]